MFYFIFRQITERHYLFFRQITGMEYLILTQITGRQLMQRTYIQTRRKTDCAMSEYRTQVKCSILTFLQASFWGMRCNESHAVLSLRQRVVFVCTVMYELSKPLQTAVCFGMVSCVCLISSLWISKHIPNIIAGTKYRCELFGPHRRDCER